SYYAEELRVAQAAAAASSVAGSATTSTSPASQLNYGRAAYVQDMVVGPFFPGDADEVRRRAKKDVDRWRPFKKLGPEYGADFTDSKDPHRSKIMGFNF
ncbi:hypothetical protein HK405_008283, partial [Cladochytrium tenue]